MEDAEKMEQSENQRNSVNGETSSVNQGTVDKQTAYPEVKFRNKK